jgi:hypothetical protein
VTVLAVGLTLATAALLCLPSRRPVRLEIGGFEDGLLSSAWGRVDREDVDAVNTTDDVVAFYQRAAPPNSGVNLPIVARGTVRLALRAIATVRSEVGVFVDGQPAGKVLLTRGPWSPQVVEFPSALAHGGPLTLSLAMRPLPLVRGSHVDNPQLKVDYLEISADGGWRLSIGAIVLVLLAIVSIFGFGVLVGLGPACSLGLAAGAAAVFIGVARVAPLSLAIAVPRLVPFALLAGFAAWLLCRAALLGVGERSALAALVMVGTLAHGAVVFCPNHNPPDLDIHVRRALDLGDVPLEYGAMMRYGSQLPTASQDRGPATAALGEQTLIPYSPLPYFFYYGASRLGFDLYWAMTVLNAALVMLAVVPLWLAGARLWGTDAAWVGAALYGLDLSIWHHLGRSHSPAVFGGALGTAALMYLLGRAPDVVSRRAVIGAGGLLGLAVLGYSSLVVLIGFFGVVLLGLLLANVGGLPAAARKGLALSLVVGGLIAGGLFYFHYVPGMLHGAAGVEAEPDAFPGRTFFIFHNESKHSMRLWMLGLWIPMLAGLVAAPIALWRAPRWARPILLSWLASWALVVILKEPALFPKLLRWAKEDQFLTPLLCVFVGAAVGAIPGRRWRLALAAAVIAGAAWLEWRDFGYHANSLLL